MLRILPILKLVRWPGKFLHSDGNSGSGMVIFAGILIALPFFFDAIEARNGYLLTDFILEWIPAQMFQ